MYQPENHRPNFRGLTAWGGASLSLDRPPRCLLPPTPPAPRSYPRGGPSPKGGRRERDGKGKGRRSKGGRSAGLELGRREIAPSGGRGEVEHGVEEMKDFLRDCSKMERDLHQVWPVILHLIGLAKERPKPPCK